MLYKLGYKKPATAAETEKAASVTPSSGTSIKKADKGIADPIPRLGSKEKPKKVGAAPAAPKTVTIQPGDTLAAIAERFYGNPMQWDLIYEANRDQIENPDVIPIGMKLILPVPDSHDSAGSIH